MIGNNIYELYNRASEALINAMGQYMDFLSLKSSINRLNIQLHYWRSLSQNNIVAEFEQLDLYDKRRNLSERQNIVIQNIVNKTQQSIIYALALIERSIEEQSKIGLDIGEKMINSIVRFIKDNKSNIAIPINIAMPEILNIRSKLINAGYRNIELFSGLNQLFRMQRGFVKQRGYL